MKGPEKLSAKALLQLRHTTEQTLDQEYAEFAAPTVLSIDLSIDEG